METSIIDEFLMAVRSTIQENNAIKLQELILIEHPLPLSHHALINELRESFPPCSLYDDAIDSQYEDAQDSQDEEAPGSQYEDAEDSKDEEAQTLDEVEDKFILDVVGMMQENSDFVKLEDLKLLQPPLPPLYLGIITKLIQPSPPSGQNGDAQDSQVEYAQDSQYDDAEDSQYEDAQDNQDYWVQDGQYEDAQDSQDEWNHQDGPFEDIQDDDDGYDQVDQYEEEDLYNQDEYDQDSQYGDVENSDYLLEARCQNFLPEYEEICVFTAVYFLFLRDVVFDDLAQTHQLLQNLLDSAISALGSDIGLVFLPTVISFSRTMARLTIDLNKRPELTAHILRIERTGGNEEAPERVTLVEGSANVIKEALDICLGEKGGPSSVIDSNNQPEGRQLGIYIIANICLKLFFHEKKLRGAEKLFENIDQQSPRLAFFPAAQRVTYLYYLGRYHFANSHFFRAQLTLQAAYDQCHSRCLKQRRLILIYLIASNIILGRFPSIHLLQQPEAFGFRKKFLPLCHTLATGDLASFRRLLHLNKDNDNAEWFFCKRILAQFKSRCEVIVWRSLARRTFLISGFDDVNANSTKAPTLDLNDLLTLATYLESKAQHSIQVNGFISPDAPASPRRFLTMAVIESTVGSLIQQDLMQGYISHRYHRFAISGSVQTNALQAGFPNVWQTISEKADLEVPGWVQEDRNNRGDAKAAKPGRGMVVRLGGSDPVDEPPVEVDGPIEVDEVFE